MYRIAWRYLSTSITGYGEYCLTLDQAQEWIKYLEKEFPEMEHKIESE
jgi:hypothetical protein